MFGKHPRNTDYRRASAVLVAVAVTWHGSIVQGAQTATVLEVRYAIGGTTRRAVDARAGSAWTGVFPRAAGADISRDGLPLAALEVSNASVGQTTEDAGPISISIVDVPAPALGAPNRSVLGVQFVANRAGRLALSVYRSASRRESLVAPGQGA